MLSFLITVATIALIAALALATLFYVGPTVQRGAGSASVSELVNTGQQISAALILRDVDEAAGAASTPLQSSGLPGPQYLASVPAGWSVQCQSGLCVAQHPLGTTAEQTCRSVNEKAGIGKTLDVTVYAMATSVFHCTAVQDAAGQTTGYVFNYLYKRAA